MEIAESRLSETYPELSADLLELEKTGNKQLQLFADAMRIEGNNIYAEEIFMQAVIDRSVSLISAFVILIENWNFIGAASLARLQLDSAMQLYFIVHHPKERERVLHEWMKETRFNKIIMFADDKKKLTDENLCGVFKEIMPQVESIYAELCGYVHLSQQHLLVTTGEADKKERIVHVVMGTRKVHLPKEKYQKLIQWFDAFTHVITTVQIEWLELKPKLDHSLVKN